MLNKRFQFCIKQSIDFLVSLVLLLALFPIFVIISFLIKIDSSGPVFYKQYRIGRNGKKFKIWKFRSMIINAENIGAKMGFIKDDPRITCIGKLLRLTSIDELPQIINILKGEMSFIGPRPTIENQVVKYNTFQRRRLLMKPGISGWAQVNGRNELKWSKRIELDIYYIENWNLWFDIKIVFRTLYIIFAGKNIRLDQRDDEVVDL